jgi:pre-mRNA-processing factor 40
MQNDRRTANIDRDALSLIFERVRYKVFANVRSEANHYQLREKASRRNEDDKHQAERKQRRAVDTLRSYIKGLEPPVRADDTYERVKPRIEKSGEYLAINSDELRRSAFDKVIRRLKEKEEDAEKDRNKRRERASVDRGMYRERDRGERSHRSSGRHARTSRSPEPDAYEADRRKAIADREKNYRKGSAADGLLSPRRSDRERDRGDRDRDVDRPHRSRREDPYERERRERDSSRERLYRRRAETKAPVDELPYGDEKPQSARRRRTDSDVESASSTRIAKVSNSLMIYEKCY